MRRIIIFVLNLVLEGAALVSVMDERMACVSLRKIGAPYRLL